MDLGYWPYVIATVGVILLALVLLFAMQSRREKRKGPLEMEAKEKWPLRVKRSVKSEEVKRAQDELRVLNLEREIMSFAIRRLYEAEAEGKINEEERERLARWYKERMAEIKDMILRSESLVALHELEGMQEDLIKLFSERFDDLNKKIDELRTTLKIKPIKEVAIPAPPTPSVAPPKEERKRPRPPPAPRKTEAEERIEKIRAEIEKVLERLGQIEAEA